MSSEFRYRKQLLWLHTWTGLTLALVVLMFAVTGAGLAIRPTLDNIVNSDLHTVPPCATPLPLDALATRARSVHPEGELRSIEVKRGDVASVAIQFSDNDYVYTDPCSADILGIQNEYGGFFGTLDWLHRFRFMNPATGRNIAGWMSLGYCAVLIVGGLFLWWPRSRAAIKSAFKFNSRLPGTARTLSLHKIVGLYTSLVLLMITITALPISFGPIKNLIYDATGYVKPDKPLSHIQPGVDPLSMEAAWQKTQTLFPELEWVSLEYPEGPRKALEVKIREQGAPHENARSYLYLDAYSGAVLDKRLYGSDMGLGRKIYLYCIALHAALVGGLPYQLLLLVAALSLPVQVYSGISPYLRRKFRATVKTTMSLEVVRKTVEAMDICSFEFADPRGKALPAFSAGSHIDVHLDNGITRQYSLCNDPGETHRYVIGVLRNECSRGGSTYLHDQVNVGDVVRVSMPKNHFPLIHGAKRSLLIAGGIGITPILCMAERLSNIGMEFTLHYCIRSLERAAFKERIKMSAFADRVQFHVSENEGRLDIAALLQSCDCETHLYVCGPNRFMDAVLDTAKTAGWPDSQVHREYFAAGEYDTGNNVAFDVRIASSGRVIHVPEDKSVVAALSTCGIEIPISCSEGVCGSCLTRVIEGEVEHRDVILSAEERARNDQFTPCCSRARSPMLVLDL